MALGSWFLLRAFGSFCNHCTALFSAQGRRVQGFQLLVPSAGRSALLTCLLALLKAFQDLPRLMQNPKAEDKRGAGTTCAPKNDGSL